MAFAQGKAGMSSRDRILSAIRTSIGPNARSEDREGKVRERISRHAPGIVPQGPKSVAARRKRFVEKAKAAAATVDVVQPGEEAEAIGNWLRRQNVPQVLRMGADRRLQRMKWPRGGPQRVTAVGDEASFTALSHAVAGIAESGTLLMLSGKGNPTSLNFLAENHIVLLDEKDIENDHEAVWARLRRRTGKRGLPRTVNMITGPSRSADIEQTLILGAHGPVRLHIIVVRQQ